ncbi:hypothetical protein U6X29_10745 [Cutibacterium acnes]|nr:hypothetical protein OYC57_000744 [Cutibacterium acnes]
MQHYDASTGLAPLDRLWPLGCDWLVCLTPARQTAGHVTTHSR